MVPEYLPTTITVSTQGHFDEFSLGDRILSIATQGHFRALMQVPIMRQRIYIQRISSGGIRIEA